MSIEVSVRECDVVSKHNQEERKNRRWLALLSIYKQLSLKNIEEYSISIIFLFKCQQLPSKHIDFLSPSLARFLDLYTYMNWSQKIINRKKSSEKRKKRSENDIINRRSQIALFYKDDTLITSAERKEERYMDQVFFLLGYDYIISIVDYLSSTKWKRTKLDCTVYIHTY